MRISKTHLSYPLRFFEIKEEGLVFSDHQFTVSCKKLDHGIESFGYRIEEVDHVGELQVEKLTALGLKPGPLFGKIKKGETVTLPDGQQINGKDYIGETIKGRVVTILGDTRKTVQSVELARYADILVHESTFNKEEAKLAKAYFHSTTQQAAEVAKAAHAKKLILTHISARYLGKDISALANEAKEIFENVRIAKDFDCFEIPLKKEKSHETE